MLNCGAVRQHERNSCERDVKIRWRHKTGIASAREQSRSPRGTRVIGQSQRDCDLQPKVVRNELPWGHRREKITTPTGLQPSAERHSSVPNIPFIPLDLVLPQQRSQFILKSYLAVMFLLSRNVLFHLFQVRLAHGEVRVAAL